jgi:hypothetical protein
MVKKLISNLKVTIVLLIIAFGFVWYVDGIQEAKTLITEYWWLWLILPFLLRFWNWFKSLNQKAFNYGVKSTDKSIEQLATIIDSATNTSKKRYDALKQKAIFNSKETELFRQRRTDEGIKMEIEIAKDTAFFVPLYRYEKGLPGKNLVRTSNIEEYVVACKIKNGNLQFYQCELKDYDSIIPLHNMISEIPLGSITKIEIIDLTETRVLRKVGAHFADKVTRAAVSSVSNTGVRADKHKVDAARLILHYVNKDGIIIPAQFVFPSNCKLGEQAIKMLSQLNRNIGSLKLLGKLKWHAESLYSESSLESGEENFDLDDVSSLVGDMITVIKWMNLLSENDSAVLSAKLSAEMIAGVIQDETVQLIETTDVEINKAK